MSVVNWGKPKLEIAAYENGALPANPTWTTLPEPVTDTTELATEEGDKVEAIEEGGGVVDTYRKKSKYSLSFELFEKKGETKPIEDNDGVIDTTYAIRLTPEDTTNNGYLMKKCSVSCLNTWKSADGGRWKYTFDALVPDDGSKMLERYVASTTNSTADSSSEEA